MPGWQRQIWWRVIAALSLLLVLAWPTVSLASDGGPVQVDQGTQASGDIATLDQSIVVAGDVAGDVTSWTGDITVEGHVAGDVVSYMGDVTVGSDGQIDGSVMSLGGHVVRHVQAIVAGPAFGSADANTALSSAMNIIMPGASTPPSPVKFVGRLLLGILSAVFLLAFSLLWSANWPNRTLAAGMTLRRLPGQSAVIGLLATGLIIVIAPLLTALLAASLVGLPLLALIIVALNAPYVYGLAALARAFVLPTRAPDTSMLLPERPVIGVLVALAGFIGFVAAFQPLAGLLVFYLVASPGLGAVLLSRAGMAAPRSLLRS